MAATIPFYIPECELNVCQKTNEELILTCRSNQSEAICPACNQASSSIHSRYERKPSDLPISDQRVRLFLHVKRFRCTNSKCKRRTFAERLPTLLPSYARRTMRLAQAQGTVAMFLGANAGSRLLNHLHMSTSHDTLLRLIRKWKPPSQHTPRVLGVDDWSIRKHVSYGTILLDLEQHRPVDLLQDRTSNTLSTWLKQHPGVEIITRDRSREYAKGAREGAPQAVQVADRWHLLHNLKQMLDRLLGGIHTRLCNLEPVIGANTETHRLDYSIRDASPGERSLSRASRERRLACYKQVKQLHRSGWNIRQIERNLGINHKTVRKYVYAESFPERARRRAGHSILNPYLSYMKSRHNEGCENATQLWREIKSQGYPGSPRQVLKWMKRHRMTHSPAIEKSAKGPEKLPLSPPIQKLPSAKQLSWLMMRDEDALEATDKEFLLRIRQDVIVEKAYGLSKQFVEMIRGRISEQLDEWIRASKTSGITVLRNFAFGIERDYAAVRAALEMQWSNGQTEGQVTRLKLIKRQMYGRASFDLLRQRVLYRA